MTYDIERLRRSYQPDRIHVLFVAESPPADGRFFYRGNTPMVRHMARAFGDPPEFLDDFKASGCFLDDLVPMPVPRLSPADRRVLHGMYVDSLAVRLRRYKPSAVVTVLKMIAPRVVEAFEKSGYFGPHYVVPFPGNGQQSRFLDEMNRIMPKLPLVG